MAFFGRLMNSGFLKHCFTFSGVEMQTEQKLSNTEILIFIVGWQGGTVHQLAQHLGVATRVILDANYDEMQDLMRLAQKCHISKQAA